MRKLGLIFLGLVLFTVGISFFTYRLQEDPRILERYEHAISGAPKDAAPMTPSGQPKSSQQGRYVDRAPSTQHKTQEHLGGLKLFEIILDLANVLVGLIGISLAIMGMRMRASANQT